VQVTFFSLTSFISSANTRKESLALQSQTEEMQLAGAELCNETTYNFASGFQCSQKQVILIQVEEAMRSSLRDVTRKAYEDYAVSDRLQWILKWPGQVVLCGSSMYWTAEVVASIHGSSLPQYEQKCTSQLQCIVNKVIATPALVAEWSSSIFWELRKQTVVFCNVYVFNVADRLKSKHTFQHYLLLLVISHLMRVFLHVKPDINRGILDVPGSRVSQ
jgi:hypothetical protein